MENIVCISSNTCCKAILKLKCWLILAKYGASKLEMVKQYTQDIALEEFELKLFLKIRFSTMPSDKFTIFIRDVFNELLGTVTKYIHSSESSKLFENETESLWILHNVISHEITVVSSNLKTDSHPNCVTEFNNVKNEILSIMYYWPDSIVCCYSNFISSSLSEIFALKIKNILCKYESTDQSTDIRWLCEAIMKSDESSLAYSNNFWFINTTLVWNSLDDTIPLNEFYFHTESELLRKLADWLFVECVNDLKNAFGHLTIAINERLGARILDREKLTRLLGLTTSELELYLMESEDQFHNGMNLADGPHYSVPDLIELQVYRQNDKNEKNSASAQPLIENGYDLLASFLQDYSEPVFETDEIVVTQGEVNEPSKLYEDTNNSNEASFPPTTPNEGEDLSDMKTQVEESTKTLSIAQLHITGNKSRNPHAGREYNRYPSAHYKRRGRPRKIDEHNHSSSKNGQHKYSQENVLDCSNWISDNFFEVAGNKPAIDRARLYELYTNYCLLKLCTPVDRALFGKIIRKVFPKLRSRRLIQNQVLKYHYVGLKPKFVELEQALLNSESSMNPQEIVLSYVSPDN